MNAPDSSKSGSIPEVFYPLASDRHPLVRLAVLGGRAGFSAKGSQTGEFLVAMTVFEFLCSGIHRARSFGGPMGRFLWWLPINNL
jgi:hypothetical protein